MCKIPNFARKMGGCKFDQVNVFLASRDYRASHSRAKFVSLELLLINYGGYQTENPTVLLLKWLTFKKYHCAALCRDATYIGPL